MSLENGFVPHVPDDVVPYRFNPIYTMMGVGVESLFRPTGGTLLFKLTPPLGNIKRKILGMSFQDVLTLDDLINIVDNTNPHRKEVEMYRPLITQSKGPDEVDVPNEISLTNFVTAVQPYGVTSISKCKEGSTSCMVGAQPVSIYGACNVDKTDASKQDTLRLPVSMCVIDDGHKDDTRHYVFMTLSKERSKDWSLKFITTPHSVYVNDEMMRSDNMSLVYPLGIIDYKDKGRDTTKVFMYTPEAHMCKPATPMYYLEGFVYNPNARWILSYTKASIDFYRNLDSMKVAWDLMDFDKDKRVITRYIRRLNANEAEGGSNLPQKRSAEGDDKSSPAKRARTTGHGNEDLIGYVFSTPTPAAPVTSLNISHVIGTNRTSLKITTSPTVVIICRFDQSKPIRAVPKHLLNGITQSIWKGTTDIMRELNKIVENKMKAKKSISLAHLQPDEAICVTSEDSWLVLAMAFIGRLHIASPSGSGMITKIRNQMNMTALFTGGQSEKLKCLVNYLYTGITHPQLFVGRSVSFIHKWDQNTPISDIDDVDLTLRTDTVVEAKGPLIEDVPGVVHADFANKHFGGGVFGRGAVQEEILLMIHPEALLGRILFPPADNRMAFGILGAVRFSNYSGYGRGSPAQQKFTFQPLSTPLTNSAPPTDQGGCALTEITTMDALDYSNDPSTQYRKSNILREFQKAIISFRPTTPETANVPVSTGRWGSGAFNGDPLLKSLIQMAASAYIDKPILLLQLSKDVKETTEYIRKHVTTITNLFNLILKAISKCSFSRKNQRQNSAMFNEAIMARLHEDDEYDEEDEGEGEEEEEEEGGEEITATIGDV